MDDTKERVRQAVDIVELIGGEIPLRRDGRHFKGICPWHDDTSPSLQVNPERQSWKCWVCNIGGDIFSFVQQREQCGFREALQQLAERAGIVLETQAKTKPGDANDRSTLLKATAWAANWFHRCLLESPAGAPGREYFELRGVQDETIRKFRLGYAPKLGELKQRGPAAGFSLPVLEAAGLVSRGDTGPYDFFRGRVMFPINDLQGRPIAFGGRILPQYATDRTGKYLNSRDTRLFNKSENLYALDLVKEATKAKDHSDHRHLVIVEGYTDVTATWQSGLENTVAVLGTALGAAHLRTVRRFADRITLLLDGDDAGQTRASQVLELFVAEQLDLRVAVLPDGLDPCDFVQQRGVEALRELIGGASDALQFKLDTLTADLDPIAEPHRADQALEEILRVMAGAPGGLETGERLLRQQLMLSRLARRFHLNEADIRERLTQLREARGRGRREASRAAGAAAAPRQPLDSLDRELLEILLLEPSLAAAARSGVAVSQVGAGPARVIYQSCLKLEEQGRLPGLQELMNALEDPQIKSLLVELDELANRKADASSDSAEARLEHVCFRYRERHLTAESRRKLSELERHKEVSEEQIDVLLQFVELQRIRQGLQLEDDELNT